MKNRISKFLCGKECTLPKVIPSKPKNKNIGNTPYSGLLRSYDNSHYSYRQQKMIDKENSKIEGPTLVKRRK